MTGEDPTRLFLWAAIGSPDEVPDRVEAANCPVCGVLVTSTVWTVHDTWHATARRGAR